MEIPKLLFTFPLCEVNVFLPKLLVSIKTNVTRSLYSFEIRQKVKNFQPVFSILKFFLNFLLSYKSRLKKL